ncbi:MAG: DUF2142 domain-containing protein [Hungatella sp.]|nr:DUF2142 domain-containing protein [Hungatella sp.]
MWHLLDVRAGAAGSGDWWLVGWYLGLFAAVVVFVVAIGRLFWSDRRLESLYLLAGTILGIFYLLVLPPLSAPDEISHYMGAYQLSSRILGQVSNAVTGHVLVRPQDIWLEDVEDCWEYEESEDGYVQPVAETTADSGFLGETLMEETYKTIRKQGILGRRYPLTAKDQEELTQSLILSPYPPVITTPVAYIPQALGISLARLFHMNTIMVVYLGRLFNLLFFVGMTFLAMKRLPFGKEVLFGVALLPMTLHLSASFSYDVMILGCMFYLTAVCLDLAYEKERVRIKDVAVMAVLMAAAGPCKLIYGVLMGLCLLIPVRKFGGWKPWWAAAACVFAAWGLSMMLVNGQTIVSYATETESVVPWAEEAGYSLTLLLHRPLQAVRMFYQTLLWQADYYHMTMIGAYLGNLDTVLDVPYFVVVMFTAGLVCLAVKKPGERQVMSVGNRVWVAVLCGLCAFAAMASMLIAWTPLSSQVINGVQGRYFLPFLPVLLMAFKNDLIVLTKNGNRSILYLMCCANGYVVLRLFSVVSMRL